MDLLSTQGRGLRPTPGSWWCAPGLPHHVTLSHLPGRPPHRDLEAEAQRKSAALKELAAEEGGASCFQPGLHIEDLRTSPGPVSSSVPRKRQGGWAGALGGGGLGRGGTRPGAGSALCRAFSSCSCRSNPRFHCQVLSVVRGAQQLAEPCV